MVDLAVTVVDTRLDRRSEAEFPAVEQDWFAAGGARPAVRPRTLTQQLFLRIV